MARITNDFFKLKGSLGDLTFVQDELGTIAKRKANVSDKRIKTDPRSKGTRDGMAEMGGASKAVKTLRLALNSKKRGFEDQYFAGRLSGVMRKAVGRGKGDPGQRKLDLRKNGSLLEGFEFIRSRPLVYSIGGIKVKPTFSAGRNEIYWTSPSLNRKEQITVPEGATHFKFILGAATISNYEYSVKLNGYVPLEPKFRNHGSFTDSDPIALNHKTIAPVNLRLKLPIEPTIPEEVAVLTAVGVSFLRNVNGELLGMKDTLAMKVMRVG